MQPSQIGQLVGVADPVVSPDGRAVAYVVARVDLEANVYRSAIWLAATDGSTAPRQLTAGEDGDGGPVWSPDGTRLAFTRSPGRRGGATGTPAGKHALHVLPVAAAGETVTLATRDEPFEGLAWSPDGERIAFVSRVRDTRYAPDDDAARPPRKVDRLMPRIDSVGWTVDRPAQLFVVESAGAGTPRQLTAAPVDVGSPTWSPDGRRVAFVAALHPDADLDVVNDVYLLDVDGEGAPPQRLTRRGDSSYAMPSWSPDGTTIATLASRGRIGYRHQRVTLVDVRTGEERVLTDELDRTAAPYPGARPPVWDGPDVITSIEDRGSVVVIRVHPDGSHERLTEAGRWVTAFDHAGGALAVVAAAATAPPELHVVRAGLTSQLTRHQRGFLAVAPALAPERFTVTSEDGTELDAWLIRPAGFDPARRYPLLLNVHGGPHTQYGERWFDEFQIYAGAGYAVLYGNPHGSTGRAESFARSILSPKSSEDPGTGWGGIDFRDCLAFVDGALARFDFLDADRVGIMGGSYGGYLTSWAVGQTDRFAAAVSERAVNNLLSLEWSSDAAGYFRYELGVSHLDAPDEYLRMSPITHVRDIGTPLLILHSEDDLRCHVEQADCLWVAMRMLGKQVDYYRFPGESHELTRSGSPQHRVQRAQLVVEWLGRHLMGNGVDVPVG
ncbi:MAG TPA: S9 family peptidase [Nocardioidaceae bacterium]|nr:S9 family peptidase [Nocardioidaceae bacterium]